MYDLDSKNNNSSNFSAKSSKQKSSALTWLWIILGIFVGFGLGLVSSGQMSSLVQNLENPLSQLSSILQLKIEAGVIKLDHNELNGDLSFYYKEQ